MGQVLLRHAGAVVSDGDDHCVAIPRDARLDDLVAAAMLGRVVQQIGKHLPQPFRVAGDGGELLLTGVVVQPDVLFPVQLPIGKYGVLKFRLDVHRFYI